MKIYTILAVVVFLILLMLNSSCKKEESEKSYIPVSELFSASGEDSTQAVYRDSKFPESNTSILPVVYGSSQIVHGGSLVLMIESGDLAKKIYLTIDKLTNSYSNYLNIGFIDETSGYYELEPGNSIFKSERKAAFPVPRYNYQKVSLSESSNPDRANMSTKGSFVQFVILSFEELRNYDSLIIKVAVETDYYISGVVFHPLTINESAGYSNSLQVSLNWLYPVDLDLHVETPDGQDIYYGLPVGQNGGLLDLDSNPACEIDNINNENITWGSNVPAYGTYIVRVDLWSACNYYQTVPYVVTVNVKGDVKTYYGEFEPSEEDFGAAYSGRVIATFDYN